MTRYIKGYKVVVLLDLINTHNFIDHKLAKQAGYFVYGCNNFQEMVVNGERRLAKESVTKFA